MILINGQVHTMAGSTWEHGYVFISGGKIKAVGPMEELAARQQSVGELSERVIDVRGAWVMPGLIDAHCHVGISEEKWGVAGEDCNETTDPVTPHIRALDAVNPMDPAFHDAIQAGITSLMTGPGSSNVVGGQSLFMKVQGRCIDRMAVMEIGRAHV